MSVLSRDGHASPWCLLKSAPLKHADGAHLQCAHPNFAVCFAAPARLQRELIERVFNEGAPAIDLPALARTARHSDLSSRS